MEPPQNPGGIKHPVGHLLGAAQPALLPPASQVPAETAVGVCLELVERLGRMGVGVVVHPAPQPVVDRLHHLAEACASPVALRQHRPHPLPGSLARLRGREDVRDVSSVLSRMAPLEAEPEKVEPLSGGGPPAGAARAGVQPGLASCAAPRCRRVQARPGNGGHRPPRLSMARAISASGERKPNATLVSRRILVLTDSTSPLDRPSVKAAWIPARCWLIDRASLTNAGMRQRRAHPSHASSSTVARTPLSLNTNLSSSLSSQARYRRSLTCAIHSAASALTSRIAAHRSSPSRSKKRPSVVAS